MSIIRLPRPGPFERRAVSQARRLRVAYESVAGGTATAEEEESERFPFGRVSHNPPSSLFVAGTLALARLADRVPNFEQDWKSGQPVLIDVPDRNLLEEIRCTWRCVLDVPAGQVLYLDKSSFGEQRNQYVAMALFTAERPKFRPASGRELLEALGWGLPCLGVSPSATACMPTALLDAARHKLTLPGLDAVVVTRTITLVTGERCRPDKVLAAVRFPVASDHLAIAVRHGRSPTDCIAELARLQKDLGSDKSRSLTLDQLHGLDPAVTWARSTITDLDAWRRGEIGWDAIDHGVVLDGPPGIGKTLFAQVFAQEAKLPLVSGSLAKWQGKGHLGDLLKSMRADFERARSIYPCIMFIDEVDAFGDRASFRHDHADYSIQVVSGLIESLDGIEGRTGIIYIAACNDVQRCDPAIIRSGRLNRVIRIGLPDEAAREAMLRVRLGPDLLHADLSGVAGAIDGASGADIEKLVKDARRTARQAKRPVSIQDLMAALDGDDEDRSPAFRERVAVHESGHALAAVLANGPEDVRVTTRGKGDILGAVTVRRRGLIGTRAELESRLVWILAGRAAEEVLLGSPSAGAGASRGSDLHEATQLAAAMVGALGLAGPTPTTFVAEANDTAEILSYPSLRAATDEILRDAYERALDLIRRHRPALDRITAELLRRKRMTGREVAAIMADVEGRSVGRSS